MNQATPVNRQTSFRLRAVAVALAAGTVTAGLWAAGRADEAPPGAGRQAAVPLASVSVTSSGQAGVSGYDGVVQAVRQTVLAAQVSGAVVALDVKAGDSVKAGQVLARLDARAAQASLDVDQRDFDRQKQLFEKRYISQAALDRAEAQYKAARTQSDFHVIRAPYAGVVSEVPVVLGDMAMPGRPLITLYDPAALRVSAAIPQSVATRFASNAAVVAEVPGAGNGRFEPVRVQLLPAVDAATHTQELRLDLPSGIKGVAPGMFARAWVPSADSEAQRLFVPAAALVRRAELVGVYVIAPDGKPLLRQVRVGRVEADRVEILSGVSAGERVATEPQAAAAVR